MLSKYQQVQCTPREDAIIHRWYAAETKKQSAVPDLVDPLAEEEYLWKRIEAGMDTSVQTKGSSRQWWSYVAAALLIVGLAGGIHYISNISSPVERLSQIDQDIAPGSHRATGIAIVNRRHFKQLFPFPFLGHQASCTQLLNGACFYCTILQYT